VCIACTGTIRVRISDWAVARGCVSFTRSNRVRTSITATAREHTAYTNAIRVRISVTGVFQLQMSLGAVYLYYVCSSLAGAITKYISCGRHKKEYLYCTYQ